MDPTSSSIPNRKMFVPLRHWIWSITISISKGLNKIHSQDWLMKLTPWFASLFACLIKFLDCLILKSMPIATSSKHSEHGIFCFCCLFLSYQPKKYLIQCLTRLIPWSCCTALQLSLNAMFAFLNSRPIDFVFKAWSGDKDSTSPKRLFWHSTSWKWYFKKILSGKFWLSINSQVSRRDGNWV